MMRCNRATLDALELRGGVYVRAEDVREDDVIIRLYQPDVPVLTVGGNAIGDVVIRGETTTFLERPGDFVCVVRNHK